MTGRKASRGWRLVLLALLAVAGTQAAGPAGAAAARAGATGTRLVTLTGTARLVAVDSFVPLYSPRGTVVARFDRFAAAPGGQGIRVMLDVAGRRLPAPPGVTGLATGDQVAVTVQVPARAAGTAAQAVRARGARAVRVARGPVAGYGPARTTARAAAGRVRGQITGPGDHRLTILPVFWSRHEKPTTAELARLDRPADILHVLGQGTAAYWAEQSAGRIRIHPGVTAWRRVPVPRGSCDEDELLDLALRAWGQQSPPGDPFQHVLVYFPRWGACGFAGLGDVGGTVTWVNGTLSPKVGAHEIGHNFGLGHARSAVCPSGRLPVPTATGCALSEYGDLPDVMGSGFGNLNSALADYLGLVDVVPADPYRTRRVTLAPLSRIESIRALRISAPGGWYYLDYRPAQGRDGPAGWAGVQAHYLASTLVPYSVVLDLQADSAPPLSRVALPVPAVWRPPGAGVAVRLESAGPAGATLVVEPAADSSPPPGPDPATPLADHRYPATVPVRWTPPPAAAGVVAQSLYLDGRLHRRLAATARSAVLTGVSAGRHRVQLVGVDQAGNQGFGRTVAFTVDPALTDPPPQLTQPGRDVVSDDSVTVSWALVGSGRTVRLLLDGVPVVAGLRTGPHTLLQVADGPHELVLQTMAGSRVVASSDPVPFTVDAVAPVPPADLAWRTGRLGWTRSSDAGSGLKDYLLQVDGGPVRVLPGVLGSFPVPLAAGAHTLTLTARDRAGNLSEPVSLAVVR